MKDFVALNRIGSLPLRRGNIICTRNIFLSIIEWSKKKRLIFTGHHAAAIWTIFF